MILAGTNDVAGNAGPVTTAQIQDNLASMAELAKLHGVRVVLASLLPVSDDKQDAAGQPLTRTRQRPTATLRELNRWLSAYAAQNGHVYLDYFSATADANGLLIPGLNDDGLHPNARGYALMAPLAEKAIAEALRHATGADRGPRVGKGARRKRRGAERSGAAEPDYPLLHSAFWLEHRLWGNDVVGYHLVSLVLHAASASLLFVILRRLQVGLTEASCSDRGASRRRRLSSCC